jgi:hypothetical protein
MLPPDACLILAAPPGVPRTWPRSLILPSQWPPGLNLSSSRANHLTALERIAVGLLAPRAAECQP